MRLHGEPGRFLALLACLHQMLREIPDFFLHALLRLSAEKNHFKLQKGSAMTLAES